ncbi:hypothetical protein Trydic_g17079 [Trypoxylus dichotomus]
MSIVSFIIKVPRRHRWQQVFKSCFHDVFISEVCKFQQDNNLPNKAALLLYNAPSHSPEEEFESDNGLISVIDMPTNVTPLIQPLNQNAIRMNNQASVSEKLINTTPSKRYKH